MTRDELRVRISMAEVAIRAMERDAAKLRMKLVAKEEMIEEWKALRAKHEAALEGKSDV